MNQLDVYYRALLNYRELTDNNTDCSKLKRGFLSGDRSADKIIIKRAHCRVDEEWVNEIEKGLVHIEKAIKEERQFIFSNGEVVPIEKVKHVSVESVKHLAKHSEMLTKEPVDDEIIPDKLYSVERLNDYTVYENRFLYMLLCYLRDFVTYRYNNILAATNKYDGSFYMDREIKVGKETLAFKVDIHNVKDDDKYLREHNSEKEIIDRIDLILKTVLAFLQTPLMEYQSKVAMLRPPITKTNVLKMDNNFKGAVALYDFIISYDKDGYTIEEETKEISPFSEEITLDVAEPVLLMSFLAYEYGLNIKSDLKAEYDREEARRRDEKLRVHAEKLEALACRVRNNSDEPMEYIYELERHIRMLEKEIGSIPALRATIDALGEEKRGMKAHIDELKKEISEFDLKLDGIRAEHLEEIERINASYSEKIYQLIISNEETLKSEREKHLAEVDAFNEHINKLIEEKRNAEGRLADEISALREKLSECEKNYAALIEAKRLCEARYLALKYKEGQISAEDVYTSRDDFYELEAEYACFTKFFKEEWKRTKKQIRRDLLNVKNFKDKDGQDES